MTPGLIFSTGPADWWDNRHVSSPQVIREDDGWKMWYYGRDSAFDPAIFGPTGRVGLATSADGMHWERVRGPGHHGSVLDPHPDPERFDSGHVGVTDVQKIDGLYWMWYLGGDQESQYFGEVARKGIPYRIGQAISRDGLHWTRLEGPVRGAIFDVGPAGAFDHHSATWGRALRLRDGSWRLYYHGLHPTNGARPALATSADGIRWEKQGQILDIGEPGRFDDRGVSCRHVHEVDGQFVMFYEGSNAAGFYAIGIATSPDGIRWTKQYGDGPRGSVLGGEPGSGAWDARAVGTPCAVPQPDGSWYLYYVGGGEGEPFRQQIGLAVSDGRDVMRFRRWEG